MPEPDDSAFFSNLAAGVSEESVSRVFAEGFGPPVISLERLDAPPAPRPTARYRLFQPMNGNTWLTFANQSTGALWRR
jgi:hypothetical protein